MVANVRISINLVPFGSFQFREILLSPEPALPSEEEETPLFIAPSVTGQGRIISLAPDFVVFPEALIS